MSQTIEISSVNFNGQSVDVTFYPCSGGSINLGTQIVPFQYTNDNYEGTYDIYISAYTKTCQLVINCPTFTPSATPYDINLFRVNGLNNYTIGGRALMNYASTYISPTEMNTFMEKVNDLQIAFNREIFV